jgi:hypothetical protein
MMLATLAAGEGETEAAMAAPPTPAERVERSATREAAERRLRERGYAYRDGDDARRLARAAVLPAAQAARLYLRSLFLEPIAVR